MGSVVNKIALIVLAGVIAAGVFYVAVPYAKNLKTESLDQRLAIEINSNATDKKPVELAIGSTTISADLALSEDEQERGLGQRTFLGENKGMLFVFDEPSYPAIWMKDMLFPIDIVWLDKDFKIVTIKSNISPNTYPKAYSPDLPSKYVLEVNAGFMDAHGISVGDTIQ